MKSCLFSKSCLVYPPSFCSGRVSISSASLMPWPLPKQVLIAPTAAQGGEEASHSSRGLGTPAPNNSLSSFPSVTKQAGDCLKGVQPTHKLFPTSGLGYPKHTPNSPTRNVLTLQPGCGHPRASLSLAGKGLAGLAGLEEHCKGDVPGCWLRWGRSWCVGCWARVRCAGSCAS